MPVMDGYQATENILRMRREAGDPEPYIVAVTADVLPSTREKCLRAGTCL